MKRFLLLILSLLVLINLIYPQIVAASHEDHLLPRIEVLSHIEVWEEDNQQWSSSTNWTNNTYPRIIGSTHGENRDGKMKLRFYFGWPEPWDGFGGVDEDGSDFALSGTANARIISTTLEKKTERGMIINAVIQPTQSGTFSLFLKEQTVFGFDIIDPDTLREATNAKSDTWTFNVDLDPPTVSVTGPSETQTGDFFVDVRFSENVTGFEADDIIFSGPASEGATATFAKGKLLIKPTKSRNLTYKVRAGAATDAAGNESIESSEVTVLINLFSDPLVTATFGPTAQIERGNFNVSVGFSENVTGFEADDIILTGSASEGTTVKVSRSLKTPEMDYTVHFYPTKSGELTYTIPADAVTDADGNGNMASQARTVTIDIRDSLTVTLTGPSGIQTGTFDITITFSRFARGLAQGEVVLGGTATATRHVYFDDVNQIKHIARVVPTSSGTLTIQVLAGAAKIPGTSVTNPASNILTYTIVVPPTVALSGVPTTPQKGAFDITITFSEDVTGFTAADIDLDDGTATATAELSGGPKVYTATITPTSEGSLTIHVPADVAEDSNQSGNTASSESTVTIDTTRPTATLTNLPSEPQAEAFDVTVAFSEDVTGFDDAADITLGGTATATATISEVDAQEYTVTITPTTAGTVTVRVPAGAAKDTANNSNTASATSSAITFDPVPPTVTLSGKPSGPQNAAFDITITFSEDVDDFDADAITFAGTAQATATVSGSGADYIATITPTGSGRLAIKIVADAVTDTAGNGNEASNILTVPIDVTPPTATFLNVPTGTQNAAFDVTILFDEEVTGFVVADDLAITGGTATASLKNEVTPNKRYKATITPDASQEADLTLQVKADAVTDAAGNNNAAAAGATVPIDTLAPTVTLSGVPTEKASAPFNVTVTFSEAVNGFAKDDVMVTGGATATAVSGSDGDATYTVTITPNAKTEADITVQVKADAVTDAAGNTNPLSDASTVSIDTVLPEIVANEGVPETEDVSAPFDLTVTFSEAVNGFTADDVEVMGPATVGLKSGSDGDLVYVLLITPSPNSEGKATLVVPANAVQDAAGNHNPDLKRIGVVFIDTRAPEMESIEGVPDIAKNVPYDITLIFSETVNGFADEDIAVTGPATAALKSGSDGDGIYVVSITPNSASEGEVTLQVKADAVQDFALNANTASAATPVGHVDTLAPTVTLSGVPTEKASGKFDVTVTFSEPVDLSVIEAEKWIVITGDAQVVGVGSNRNRTSFVVTIRPHDNKEGDVTIQFKADMTQDAAGNKNTASTVHTVSIDTVPPKIVANEGVPEAEAVSAPFDLTVTFSEPVNGFTAEDVEALGPATVSLKSGSDGDSVYVLLITPTPNSDERAMLHVPANAVQDAAGNHNPDLKRIAVVFIDTRAPEIESIEVEEVENVPLYITFTFSETVNGFADDDVVVTGPATVHLKSGSDGDSVYVAGITPNPNSEGEVTVQVKADAVQDFALNTNAASDATPVGRVDTLAPTVAITEIPTAVQLADFSVNIEFSEAVTGFDLTDITLSGDAVVESSVLTSDSENAWTLTITPHEDTDGDVIITVPVDSVQDVVLHTNAASLPQAVPVAPAWIPDPNLRAAIRVALGLAEGEDFSRTQLSDLETLRVPLEVTDLTGLEHAVNLNSIDVKQSQITSLKALENATQLTFLDLSDNSITDITRLQHLTELTTLNLSGNTITDITSLAGLTKLAVLDLSDNAITDITPLEDLTNLTVLDLRDNAITDITPLEDLTALTVLFLNNNPISSLVPVASLTSLTTLHLNGNALSDLSALSGLTGLQSLNLSDNAITSSGLNAITGLTALTQLSLGKNKVTSLTAVANFTQLISLNLNDNSITDVSLLTSLTALEYLYLDENAIADVQPLAGLINLRTLRLTENPILNTAPLYPLTQRVPPVDIDITVAQYPPWDVNEDGKVDAADSALVTAALGQSGAGIANSRTDVNGDGTVDNDDLLLVTQNLDNNPGAAPAAMDTFALLDPESLAGLDRASLKATLDRLLLESDGSQKYLHAIRLLQNVLAQLTPEETRLFANYPNPFNPETWIPYQLAKGSDVEIFIYDARGVLVRHLALGHQRAGYYTEKSRAAYWDGRNSVSERVASGIYFYRLQAENTSLLRKMLILK